MNCIAESKWNVLRGIVVLAIFGSACGPGGSPPPSPSPESLRPGYDLTLLWPRAEIHREVAGFDFGADGPRRALVSGWSWNERTADSDVTFVWSDGSASVLDLFLVEPRDLRVELVVQPYALGEGPAQTVTPRVGERTLPTIELASGFHEVAFDVPAEAIRAGRNRMTFTYGRVASPRELGRGDDDRKLAVAWDRLEVRPATYVRSVAEAPRIEPGPSLRLPFGTAMDWYLEVSGEPWLTVGERRLDGSARPGRVDVYARVAEDSVAEGQPIARWETGGDPRAVRLPGEGRRLVRVSLHAVADDPDRPVSGALVVERPEIRFGPGGRRSETPSEEPQVSSSPTSPRRPLVMIYLVDTLRADRVGVYGAERPLTPEIDAFASESTLFEQVVAQSPWTRPSSASVLTGLTPWGHGVQTLQDSLPDVAVSLPEILQEAGYRTAAFSTNGHVTPRTGFDQGFDDFYFFTWNPPSSQVNEGIVEWLDEVQAEGDDRPLFLYVHTLDPHAPYDPPDDLRERFAPGLDDPKIGTLEYMQRAYGETGEERRRLVAALPPLYDAEVAANDRSFGALLDVLRDRGLYEEALVIFVSDHGEEFDEHGFLGHGNNLHGESLNVPLLIRWPGRWEGVRVPHRAQHVDLLPTILTYLGLGPPEDVDLPGLDLARLAAAAETSVPERSLVSHLDYEERRAASVVRGDWKLIEPRSTRSGRWPRLYRVSEDPMERLDLHEDRPLRSGWLASWLRAVDRTSESLEADETELDEETRKSLEALGYF